MGWIILLFTGTFAVSLQHSMQVGLSWHPDLVWALLAWFAVQPVADHAVLRVWVVTCIRDQVDPSSLLRHSVLGIGLVITLGAWLHTRQGWGSLRWLFWAACAIMVESFLSGALRSDTLVVLGRALSTGLLAMFIGACFDGLHHLTKLHPERVHEDWQSLLGSSHSRG